MLKKCIWNQWEVYAIIIVKIFQHNCGDAASKKGQYIKAINIWKYFLKVWLSSRSSATTAKTGKWVRSQTSFLILEVDPVIHTLYSRWRYAPQRWLVSGRHKTRRRISSLTVGGEAFFHLASSKNLSTVQRSGKLTCRLCHETVETNLYFRLYLRHSPKLWLA